MYNTMDNNSVIKMRLKSLSVNDDEYWSFRKDSNREYCHGLFQYPAMMVPQLVRVILHEICNIHKGIKTIGDPFAGSGTVLTECMMLGKSFYGVDINPLAILLCEVKKGPFHINELEKKISRIIKEIASTDVVEVETYFTNIDKWFRPDVRKKLSIIKKCIRKENDLWTRKFLWVALADTVRLTSNSRTSTFKLHIRTKNDIYTRENNVQDTFIEILNRNCKLYAKQATLLRNLNLLNNDVYKHDVSLTLGDIRNMTTENKCDLIVTSPPYGDNATTVPYGQYSFLPLQWIDIEDISGNINYDPLASTHAIDSASLGGSKKIANSEIQELSNLSCSFAKYRDSIRSKPRDRISRVASFIRDVNTGLPKIMGSLHGGGLMIWVLGNRMVGGNEVPFDNILIELLANHGAEHVHTIIRTIPTKRMALKNNLASTMSKERIVVIRKR